MVSPCCQTPKGSGNKVRTWGDDPWSPPQACSRPLTPNRPSRAIPCSIPARHCYQVSNHTDAVLDLISVERKIPLQIAPFALKPLLEDIVAIAQSSAESEGVEIKLHVPGFSTERMAGDAYRIKQVVLILVEHVISLSCRGVMISAETSTSTCPQGPSCSDLVLRVQGIGGHMSEQQVNELTEYVRKRSLDGVGDEERASLWICGQIVSAMGGSLGIVGDPGLDQDRGACFFVSLSLLNWVASESTERSASPSRYSLSQGSDCHQASGTPLNAFARGSTAESIPNILQSQSSELQKDLSKQTPVQYPKPFANPLVLQSPRQSTQVLIEHDRSTHFSHSQSMDPHFFFKLWQSKQGLIDQEGSNHFSHSQSMDPHFFFKPRQSKQGLIDQEGSNHFSHSQSMDPHLIFKIHASKRNPEAGHQSRFQGSVSDGNFLQVSSSTVAIKTEECMSLQIPGALRSSHSITPPFQSVAPQPVSPLLLATPSTSMKAPDPLRHEGPSTNLAKKVPSICGSKSDGQIMRHRKVRVMESSSPLPIEGLGGAVGLRRQPSSSEDEATSIPVCPSDAAPQSDVHSLRQLRLKALYVSTAPVNISIIEACLWSVGLHEVHVTQGLVDALKLFKEQPDIDVVIIDHEVPMEGMEVSKAMREMQGSRRLYILMLAQALDAQLLRLTLNYSPDIVDYWLARPFSRARLSSLLMKFFVQPAPPERPEQEGVNKASMTDLKKYLAEQSQSLRQDSATPEDVQ